MGQQGYYCNITLRNRTYFFAATNKGLCYMNIYSDSLEDFQKFSKRWYPNFEWKESKNELNVYIQQFNEYFQGKRKHFSFPTDLQGTNFQKNTWKVLQTIPYGEVVSYSYVANQLEKPSAVRAVGGAVGANPILIMIPCHRVIGKNGSLTGFSAGLDLKKELLHVENILLENLSLAN